MSAGAQHRRPPVSLLELTDTGRSAAEQVPVVLSEVQNAYLSGFSEGEWAQLLDMLRRLLANAERVKGAAEPAP